MTKSETDYQRAWRERGEAEAALRKWRSNQSSPAFIKCVAVLSGLTSVGLIASFIQQPSWALVPVLLLAALFGAMPLLCPSALRNEAKARSEAKATLQRLGLWRQAHD